MRKLAAKDRIFLPNLYVHIGLAFLAGPDYRAGLARCPAVPLIEVSWLWRQVSQHFL
jgi:hypothetical protein